MNNSYLKTKSSRSGFGRMDVVGFASMHVAQSGALTTVRQSQGTVGTANVV